MASRSSRLSDRIAYAAGETARMIRDEQAWLRELGMPDRARLWDEPLQLMDELAIEFVEQTTPGSPVPTPPGYGDGDG